MSPLAAKLVDVAVAIALTAAIVCVVIVFNNLLTMPRNSWSGFAHWYSFILRPDILGMMILTAAVTTGYSVWQRGRGR